MNYCLLGSETNGVARPEVSGVIRNLGLQRNRLDIMRII